MPGARLFSRCFGAFVADDGEPSAPIRSATRLLHICLSPISLPLFFICFSFGPFPLQPLLISECFVTGLISWFLAGVCVCECNLFVISLALFACTGKGWIYDGWSIYLVRCGLLWRTYAQIYPSIHPCLLCYTAKSWSSYLLSLSHTLFSSMVFFSCSSLSFRSPDHPQDAGIQADRYTVPPAMSSPLSDSDWSSVT